jgi:16S rRNA (cytidine1402-2'-O)-methyltransferase
VNPGLGRVILLGAPLGNIEDASPRLRAALETADVIAAEDTRRLHRLARDLGLTLSARIVSYFEGNDDRRTPELVQAALDGATVAVVTDGGMPSVSDPGFRLVRAAVEAGVPVTAAPGPSAVTTALAVSGLPSDRFCFEGFLPRKPGERRARLAALAGEERTLVLFEAPHRLAATLADAAEAFGAERPAAVCRELTKTYEEVRRASLGELASWVADGNVRGEITVVIGGAPVVAEPRSAEELAALVAEAEASGVSRKEAITAVARAHGVPRRSVYEAVLLSRRS